MKKHILLLVALVFAATTWTQAQTILDFKLVNNTGDRFLCRVFDRNRPRKDWGEDILPEDIVEDGAVIDITFDYVGDETICTLGPQVDRRCLRREPGYTYINEIRPMRG